MRIWKGTEREDNVHKMTMFVESKTISENVVEVVRKMLKGNPDVKRVYFGAGGVENENALKYVAANLDRIKVEKIAEIRADFLASIDTSVFDKVILTIPVKRIDNIVPKIQSQSVLKVFKEDLTVDFSEVVDGCYNNDVEIFKE